MKKMIVLLSLLCFSALWCYADEGMGINKDNQTTVFFPNLSLSTVSFGGGLINQTFLFDHSTLKSTWGMGTLEWGQADLKIKKYSSGDDGIGPVGIALLSIGIAGLLIGLVALAVGG
jgi:hypothetical protein